MGMQKYLMFNTSFSDVHAVALATLMVEDFVCIDCVVKDAWLPYGGLILIMQYAQHQVYVLNSSFLDIQIGTALEAVNSIESCSRVLQPRCGGRQDIHAVEDLHCE